jgi:hypothetical protein
MSTAQDEHLIVGSVLIRSILGVYPELVQRRSPRRFVPGHSEVRPFTSSGNNS